MSELFDPIKTIKELLQIEESFPLHQEEGVVWRKIPSGVIHRKYGPAVSLKSEKKEWRINGVLHRLDGPAVILPDGTEEYYINGKNVSKLLIKSPFFYPKQ